MMKRPKIADMTEVERVRFRCFQMRRAAQRELKTLACVKEPSKLAPEILADMQETTVLAKTTIAALKPSWIRTASRDELFAVMKHLVLEDRRN